MNINVEHQSNCRAVIHAHATTQEVAKHRNHLIASYARSAKMPGYRPGKVPAAVILKRYGDAITDEVERQVAGEALQTAVKNEGLELLNILNVSNKIHHDTDRSYSCDIEVSLTPKFELPEYKGIPVKLPRVEVNDADVDHDLLHLRERFQTFDDVERAADLGDVVVLGYEVYLDSQPVAEAMPDAPDHLKSLEQQWFLLDKEDDFLPSFYAGLQGITANEQRNLDITLPEDFSFEALRSKTLQFQVTCGGVKEKKLPELTEDFAQKVGGPDMTTETLRIEVADGLRRRREQAREVTKSNLVLEHLSTKIEFELPQEVVNRAAQRRTNDIAQRAMRQGVSTDELVNQQEAILNSATQQARQDVKISFILEEVAKAEKLEVEERQLQMALAQMAGRSQMPIKKFLAKAQKDGTIENLRNDLLLQNALEFLKDNAVIEDIDPEPEHCETHSPAASA